MIRSRTARLAPRSRCIAILVQAFWSRRMKNAVASNWRGVCCARQVPLPIVFNGHRLDCGYRLDVVVEERMIVEVKSIEQPNRMHSAQILTCLTGSGLH